MFIILAILLMPSLFGGVGTGMMIMETHPHPENVRYVELLDVILGLTWIPVAGIAAWLRSRGGSIKVNPKASLKTLPTTVIRLFAWGTPIAFLVGLASGIWLAGDPG